MRPEGPQYRRQLRPFRAQIFEFVLYQGRRASRLPLAIIFRAVGALVRVLASKLPVSFASGVFTGWDCRIHFGGKVKRARILVAEDHELMREKVVRLLRHDFEVLAAVTDGQALLEA